MKVWLSLQIKDILGKDETSDESDSDPEEGSAGDEIWYGSTNLEKIYIGSDEQIYGKKLRTALWGPEGLTESMIDPERIDGRQSADPERVELFRGWFHKL